MCGNVSTLSVVLKAFIKKQKLNFRKSLPKILETRKEKEESTLLIEALKTKKELTPQLNEVFKNTEKPQIFCGNVSKKK